MKVLLIDGSPKGEKSATLKLAKAFLEGADVSYEFLRVSKLKINSCLGCFACWNKTPGKCVHNDDMFDVLEKLKAADVVVWSFPLYYFSVPGGLKILIDRQLPLSLPFMGSDSESGSHPARFDLSRQRHVIVSTCGFWTAAGNYDAVVAMFERYYGERLSAKIFCGQGELFGIPELKNETDAYLETVRRAGAEFAGGGISPETVRKLEAPLFPRETFEKMADASWGVDAANEKIDESLVFTRQMTALFKPDGKERTLEFFYSDLNKTYQILIGKQNAEVITENFKNYTTRIETPYSVWRAISRGETSGAQALFERKYKVLGDFETMLNWDYLFGGAPRAAPDGKNGGKKTNMAVLLIPWIAIWVAAAITPIVGGVAGIVAAALVPLARLAFKPVIYEEISVPAVAGLSLAAILGADAQLIVLISYGLFGLIWTLSAFAKIPLTARYSANGYGGERAFLNPLFIQTNRIITAAWGVLYLLTPVWTYYLAEARLITAMVLVNFSLPALMGVFTARFQKWYPAKFAQK
jgi:putative NADPH-quinone reductase/putative sterol carrier protein